MNTDGTGGDVALLEKYRIGRVLDVEDKVNVARLNSVGLIRCGYDLDMMMKTARTTDIGLKLLND